MRGETEPGGRIAPARVVIADDHEVVREGFERMLGYEQDLELVGEASNGREAVELCRSLKPDVVLMDVRMPQMDGLEATRMIKAEQPEINVLIITTYENPDYLLEAIKAGAAGYVLKDAPSRELTNAVRRALEGKSPVNQELATQVIRRLAAGHEQGRTPTRQDAAYGGQGTGSAGAHSSIENLTPRELEVVALLARGMSNPQIARELGITPGTAKIHVEHIIRKLGVSDRTRAVERATELGLLAP